MLNDKQPFPIIEQKASMRLVMDVSGATDEELENLAGLEDQVEFYNLDLEIKTLTIVMMIMDSQLGDDPEAGLLDLLNDLQDNT